MKYPPCFPRGYNAAAVDHKAAGERLVSEQSNLPRSIGLPAAHVRIRTIAVVTGLLVAAVTAFVSVKWLVGYVSRKGLGVFAWYRLALGGAILAFLALR